MKILHTADWHLGKRLNRVDRSGDLRRALEQVFGYCEHEDVDVLVIAGDLFDNVCRADDICAAIDHLKDAMRPFLLRGGTALAVTGNHDGETFCNTLRHTLDLADPTPAAPGARLATGRFHLMSKPAFHRLADRMGQEVQFVLMPHPLASRYLDDSVTSYQGGAAGKNRKLREAFIETLGRIRNHSSFDPRLHSVLVTHLFLGGAVLSGGYTMSEDDEKGDVICPPGDLGAGWAYVALGDVHKPQTLGGLNHVRYCGSIDRINFDERGDDKCVVLVEIGPEGRRREPVPLPLEATPMLDVVIDSPCDELEHLESTYHDATRAIVRCQVTYTPGVDDLDLIHRRIDEVFPRCYQRIVTDASRPSAGGDSNGATELPQRGVRETVLSYLEEQLNGKANAEAVLAAAEDLLAEVNA